MFKQKIASVLCPLINRASTSTDSAVSHKAFSHDKMLYMAWSFIAIIIVIVSVFAFKQGTIYVSSARYCPSILN